MKFNQKIFLMSYILVTVAIYLIGYFMIGNNHKTNIETQLNKSISQINMIHDEYELYGRSILNQVGEMYLKDNIHIAVLQGDKIIYTNIMQIEEDLKERIIPEDGTTKSYIKDQQLYLCFREKDVLLYTITDIHSLFETRKQQIQFFIQISMVSAFFISITLYIGVSIITRKMKPLREAANEILKGNYQIKVKKLGKDEFGTFARTFNEMTDSINETMNKITKISEERKNFIGNLTHEIRTPLTSIIGYSSLIKNGKVKDLAMIEDYATRINEEGMYMKQMSQKLMDLLLVEEAKLTLELVSLTQIMKDMILDLQRKFPEAIIQSKIAEDVTILADEVLVKSVIYNLVKNAIHAYEQNQKAIVVILLEETGTFEIIDQGKGIPEEELEKIKNPFYTLNKDRNREFSGMGLGLPLCIKIVQAHGGSLEIESKWGEGTAIIVNLGEKSNERENKDNS